MKFSRICRRRLVVAAPLLMGGIGAWRIARAANRPLRIVVILPSDRNPFWIEVARGAEQARSEIGDNYTVRISASRDQDAQNQVQLLNGYLVRNEVDALVLGPASDTETVPVIAEYVKGDIPIVTIDTELDSKELGRYGIKVNAFIGSNNSKGGELAAQEMARALSNFKPPRRVLLIEGSLVHQSAIDRARGFLEEANRRDLETTVANAEWKRDRAQEIVAAQFARRQFEGIFASNDDMAMGAIAALLGSGIPKDQWPVIIGFDATRDARDAIGKGLMYASIAQDAIKMGRSGVHAAARILSKDREVLPRELLDVNVVGR